MWMSADRVLASRCQTHDLRSASHVAAASKKQKPQKPRRRKPKRAPMDQRMYVDADLYDDEDEYEEEQQQPITSLTSIVPSAPPPASRAASVRPEDLYPVYAKPASAVSRVSRGSSGSGAWSWDDADAQAEAVVPEWNPRTGFMRLPDQVSAAEGAPSTSGSSSSTSSNGTTLAKQQQQQDKAPAGPSSASEALGNAQSLTSVGRGQILKSCVGLSAGMTVAALLLRAYAQQNAAAALGTDPQVLAALLAVPHGLGGDGRDAAVLLAAAGTVTAARAVLLATWGAFREATERSNQQVLAPLGWPDVVLVALLTGGSEELLFRGALIPASFPDWRGVLLAGALFGVLHNSGGRNAAFAAWATGVGCLYGGAYLYTGNLWVPAGAHALANFASAAMWLSSNNNNTGGSSSASSGENPST